MKVSGYKINITNYTHLFYFCPAQTYSYSRSFVHAGGEQGARFLQNATDPRLQEDRLEILTDVSRV